MDTEKGLKSVEKHPKEVESKMATKRGCRKRGFSAPKKRGGSCGAKLKMHKGGKKRYGRADCRDASGSFVPVPQCIRIRRRRR